MAIQTTKLSEVEIIESPVNPKFLVEDEGEIKRIPSKATISLGLTSAEVGQVITVKEVDETGKPTEWEAIDFPSGEEIQVATDNDIIDALIENDLLCALVDEDGSILTDEFDNILV